MNEATGEAEEDWFKPSDKDIDDELAAQGMRRADAEKGEAGWYVTVNCPGSDGRSTQKVWATDVDDNLDEAVGDKEDDWFLQSDEEVDDKLAAKGLRKADAGTPGRYRNVDGKRVWSSEVNEDGPVGYEGCESKNDAGKVEETFSFDRYMDNILLSENRSVQSQPDSPQRILQSRRQESPNGRTRFMR
jgi:hypothetical protein